MDVGLWIVCLCNKGFRLWLFLVVLFTFLLSIFCMSLVGACIFLYIAQVSFHTWNPLVYWSSVFITIAKSWNDWNRIQKLLHGELEICFSISCSMAWVCTWFKLHTLLCMFMLGVHGIYYWFNPTTCCIGGRMSWGVYVRLNT